MVKKLIAKIKNKLNDNTDFLKMEEDYIFSAKEMEDLSERNKKKLENLKTDKKKQKKVSFSSVSNKLDGVVSEESLDELPIIENVSLEDTMKEEANDNLDINKESLEKLDEENFVEINDVVDREIEVVKEEMKENLAEDSYINLSEKKQTIIMNSWNNIDLQQIDKDIMEGKELLNHNYNITYGDNAARFVHDIRKKYEVVICYLIGFNNEKKGIFNKTIFADRVDDEWKYLSNYIKLLEKIRSNRK